MKRILILAFVLALLGTMLIGGAALAKGPAGDAGQARQGATYGPGDGSGPTGGGSYGPGPYGTCVDLDGNGICDCKE